MQLIVPRLFFQVMHKNAAVAFMNITSELDFPLASGNREQRKEYTYAVFFTQILWSSTNQKCWNS